MPTDAAPRRAASPAGAMLRAGLLVGGIAGALVAAIAAPVSGRAVVSTGVGVAIALLALCAGPALLSAARRVSPPTVMALAVAGYGVTVMVLAVGYVVLEAVPWLAGDRVGYGLIAATAGSLAGQVRAVARFRAPVFDEDVPGDR